MFVGLNFTQICLKNLVGGAAASPAPYATVSTLVVICTYVKVDSIMEISFRCKKGSTDDIIDQFELDVCIKDRSIISVYRCIDRYLTF